MSFKTITETKTKTSVKNKIAVGMIATGAIALAAVAIAGGNKSSLLISQKLSNSSHKIIADSKEVILDEINFSAGNKDIQIPGIPIEIHFKSGFNKNKDIIKNIKLYIEEKNCDITMGNNKMPDNCYNSSSYGYNKIIQIGEMKQLDKTGKAFFNLQNNLIILASQNKTIIIKADVGIPAKSNETILVSISNNIKANFMNGTKAIVKIKNRQWRKIAAPAIDSSNSYFKINLLKGWNFISLPAEPENPAIEVVLADIKGKYEQIIMQNDYLYLSEFTNSTVGNLKEIHAGEGFQIKMREEGSILVKEKVVPTIFFLPISQEGWNWVGIKSINKKTISESLDLNKFLEIKTFDAGAEDPLLEEKTYPKDFLDLEPGKGYKIRYSEPKSANSCSAYAGKVCKDYEVCDGNVLLASDTNRCCSGQCKIPEEFDWRNRHGENWNSPVKDQGNAGTCRSFAPIATFEAQVNLYFNQHLNLDLSEQMIEDCLYRDFLSESAICRTKEGYDLNFCKTQNWGIPDESCDQYKERQTYYPLNNACTLSNICTDWASRGWKNTTAIWYDLHPADNSSDDIPGRIEASYPDDIKKYLIKNGPMVSGVTCGNHAMSLAGYETDSKGEILWIFKNSAGAQTGKNGYVKAKINNYKFGLNLLDPIQPQGPFIPPSNKSFWPPEFDNKIKCVDRDNDGFCNWGILENKPDTCATSCKPEKDWDDSNPKVGALDIYKGAPHGDSDASSAIFPTLSISLNASTPKESKILAGQKNVIFSVINLAATEGDVIINQISIDFGSSGKNNFSNIRILDGTNLLGSLSASDIITAESGWATIQTNQLKIKSDSSKIITIIGDLSLSAIGSLKLGIIGMSFKEGTFPCLSGDQIYGNNMIVETK